MFFGLQVALPLSIRHSLTILIRSRARIREIAPTHRNISDLVTAPLLRFLRLEDSDSRLAGTIAYCVGLTAFVWNTYQNQRPGVLLPFDFWDSSNHVCGFWITRAYKLYLFGWLLPYIALIHTGILVVILRLIRQARLAGSLKLVPFHADGVSGLGFVPGLVTAPIIVTLLMGAIPTAAAFEVHRAADVTPLMGLAVLLGSTAVAYVVPISFLRTDIVALKTETLARLRLLQQTYYSEIVEDQNIDVDTLRNGNEALEYFEKIYAKVESISNYPHLRRVLKYVGIAATPTFLSLALKVGEKRIPLVTPLLRHA